MQVLEAVLVCDCGAEYRRLRAGLQGAPAPVDVDGPACVGRFGVLGPARCPAVEVQAEPRTNVHLAGVHAQLCQVPARAVGPNVA